MTICSLSLFLCFSLYFWLPWLGIVETISLQSTDTNKKKHKKNVWVNEIKIACTECGAAITICIILLEKCRLIMSVEHMKGSAGRNIVASDGEYIKPTTKSTKRISHCASIYPKANLSSLSCRFLQNKERKKPHLKSEITFRIPPICFSFFLSSHIQIDATFADVRLQTQTKKKNKLQMENSWEMYCILIVDMWLTSIITFSHNRNLYFNPFRKPNWRILN